MRSRFPDVNPAQQNPPPYPNPLLYDRAAETARQTDRQTDRQREWGKPEKRTKARRKIANADGCLSARARRPEAMILITNEETGAIIRSFGHPH